MQVYVLARALEIHGPFAFDYRSNVDRTFHQRGARMFQSVEVVNHPEIVWTRFTNNAVMSVVEVRFVEADMIARLQLG